MRLERRLCNLKASDLRISRGGEDGVVVENNIRPASSSGN